jgi:Tfp pilus assembly protein PilF
MSTDAKDSCRFNVVAWNARVVLLSSAAVIASVVSGCATPPAPQAPASTSTKVIEPVGAQTYATGAIALKQGNVADAEQQLKEAIKVNPELRMPHIKLGEIYRNRQDYQQAVPHLEAVAKLDPYNQENMYFLGLSYQLLERFQDSALAYLRALKLDADDSKSTVNLGAVYYKLGQSDPAIFYLQRATELDKDNPKAWSNLGVALDGKGDLPGAESAYRRALELDPASTIVMQNLTTNLLDQNRADDAASVATALTERLPSAGSFRVLGSTLARAKKWTQAQAAFDRALAANPRDAATLAAMGDMNIARYVDGLELDDALRVQALDQYRASLALEPNQPQLLDKVKQFAVAGGFNRK